MVKATPKTPKAIRVKFELGSGTEIPVGCSTLILTIVAGSKARD